MTLFLLAALVKVTIGLLLAGLATRLVRPPAVRHAVWSAALAGALLLPALMLVLPSLALPVPPALLPAPGAAAAGEAGKGTGPASPSAPAPGVPWLVLAWVGGTMLVLGRLVRDLERVRRLTGRAVGAVPDSLGVELERVAADLRIPVRVQLRLGRNIVEPATWGWRRPVVLLPEAAAQWPADRLRMVLQHELAHIRRRDYLTHLLGQVACAVYWPSPAVWTAARCARLEQERACDAEVLARGAVPHEYARLLLEVARGSMALPGALGARMASRGSSLAGRVRAVLGAPSSPGGSAIALRAAALGAVAAWLPLAQIAPGRQAEATVTPPAVSAEDKHEPALSLTAEERAAARVMLASPEDWVREAGAWALRQDSAAGPRATLATVALTAQAPRLRMLATTTLRELQRPEQVPVWLAALGDTCPSVRWNAMRALRDLADPRAFDAVAERLRTDPYPPVRQMAVRAMGRYAGPEAAAALEPALRDSVGIIRTMTRRVLGLIAPRAVTG